MTSVTHAQRTGEPPFSSTHCTPAFHAFNQCQIQKIKHAIMTTSYHLIQRFAAYKPCGGMHTQGLVGGLLEIG